MPGPTPPRIVDASTAENDKSASRSAFTHRSNAIRTAQATMVTATAKPSRRVSEWSAAISNPIGAGKVRGGSFEFCNLGHLSCSARGRPQCAGLLAPRLAEREREQQER